MKQRPIYLDNHATTRCDPRVVEAMLPFFTQEYGNSSSPHHLYGRNASEAVDAARESVARLIGAKSREIIFTSGATESNQLALSGVMRANRMRGDHLITSATEHKSVLDTAKRLEREGFKVTMLPVDAYGDVDPQLVEAAITNRTILVSLMAANNEVGTLLRIREIGKICRQRGVWFHSDAVQMAGKMPVDVEAMQLDLVSLSAHKIYGPKGVGALYVRRPEVRLEPMLIGGGQERGMRSGTVAVPLVVGFGVACQLCADDDPAEMARRRDLLETLIVDELDGVTRHGHPTRRLPNNLNLGFAWVNGSVLLINLRGVAVSNGSACTSSETGPSYVLKAMGVEDEEANASLRFGLGRFTTDEEIPRAAIEVVETVNWLRASSPAYEMHRFARSRI